MSSAALAWTSLGFGVDGAVKALHAEAADFFHWHLMKKPSAQIARDYLKTFSIATHGAVMSHKGNYLDLDPTYRDVFGRPLMRMTFDYTDNEHRMSDYLTDRATEVAKAMGGREIKANPRKGSWDVVPYQTTHNTGGAIAGDDPRTSFTKKYLQSWDVPNVFVTGASAFPHNSGYNPTGPVGALAYWMANAIREKYLKNPGALV